LVVFYVLTEGAFLMTPTTIPKTADGLDSLSPSVTDALRQSPIPALRKLSVEESETRVVISGRVTSYYLKQLAQEAAMPLLDCRNLHNQVTVVRH
jgi:hypothetical protein